MLNLSLSRNNYILPPLPPSVCVCLLKSICVYSCVSGYTYRCRTETNTECLPQLCTLLLETGYLTEPQVSWLCCLANPLQLCSSLCFLDAGITGATHGFFNGCQGSELRRSHLHRNLWPRHLSPWRNSIQHYLHSDCHTLLWEVYTVSSRFSGVGEVFGFCSSDKSKGDENSSTERREKQRKAESAGPIGRIQHRREKGMSLETQAVRNAEREDGDQEERRWWNWQVPDATWPVLNTFLEKAKHDSIKGR